MREIKFRGKHIHAFLEPSDTGIWVYGYLCNDHYINSEELMGEMLVDKDTVGQYTGLKDKNGTEIYEGDILKYMAIADGEQIDKVIFDRGTYVVDYSEDYKQPVDEINHCAEVIGNIYDNPELLKGESNR